jgi:low affinity Fe/Cu permease
MQKFHQFFERFARRVAEFTGSFWGFLIAVLIVVGWLVSGPFLHFSDLWQLSINTGTTIVTFLMVFLIQQSQNTDNRSIQIKLDELIKANKDARNSLIGAEKRGAEQLKQLESEIEEKANEIEEEAKD